ncbi:hypothetical protein, partial [Deinococcus wulumuqiensis]
RRFPDCAGIKRNPYELSPVPKSFVRTWIGFLVEVKHRSQRGAVQEALHEFGRGSPAAQVLLRQLRDSLPRRTLGFGPSGLLASQRPAPTGQAPTGQAQEENG